MYLISISLAMGLIFLIALTAFVIYFPVIAQTIKLRKVENNLNIMYKELDDLKKEYMESNQETIEDALDIVDGLTFEDLTNRYGEGPSQNSGLKFKEAHKNQEFAINTIMNLIADLY